MITGQIKSESQELKLITIEEGRMLIQDTEKLQVSIDIEEFLFYMQGCPNFFGKLQ